ncbi:hypothetical protein DPEC_G00242800 [Dallia pectoralis]|uniref:Uncharacterized protein n=1 Tax=Dallia pectoralis TaxID=75939 RepID=A0ACC2FVL1_DALPE|nr:hypothetical protein DPEC_G00242800 [Dallia pectoralis]
MSTGWCSGHPSISSPSLVAEIGSAGQHQDKQNELKPREESKRHPGKHVQELLFNRVCPLEHFHMAGSASTSVQLWGSITTHMGCVVIGLSGCNQRWLSASAMLLGAPEGAGDRWSLLVLGL